MTTTTEIYNAFHPLVTAYAESQSPPMFVAYPNGSGNPPDNEIYIDFRVFWNDGQNYGLSDEGPKVERGIFRLIVNAPSDSYLEEAQIIAEELVTEFKKGTTFGGARVDEAPTIRGPIQKDDWWMVPVSVEWRATRTS